MSKTETIFIKEIDERLVSTHTFTEAEYMSSNPSNLRPTIISFINELIKLSTSKIEIELLKQLSGKMAASVTSINKNVVNYLDHVIADEMIRDAKKVDGRDEFIIEFSFPIRILGSLDNSKYLTTTIAMVLYFWNEHFEVNQTLMSKSINLAQNFQDVVSFFQQREVLPASAAKPEQNVAHVTEKWVSVSELEQKLANLKVSMSEYTDQNSAILNAKFKELGKIYVPIQRQEIMIQAVKEAKAAKTGFDDQTEAIGDVIEHNSVRFEKVMVRAEEFAKYKALDGYFERKALIHYVQFGAWLAVFVISLVTIIYNITMYGNVIKPMLPSISNNGTLSLGSSALVIAIALAVVWLLRVFIKLAMLNLHLAEDASNRTVLIRTLAALESENEGLPKEQKIIAYNAIFRASLADNSSLDVAQPSLGDLSGLFGKR